MHYSPVSNILQALANHPDHVSKAFIVQRYKKTLVVIRGHHRSWNRAQVGNQVENLILRKHTGKYYSSNMLRIGEHRLLVTAEVDGSFQQSPTDQAYELVEIKSSSSKKKGYFSNNKKQLAVQLVCNRSKHILSAKVDQNEGAVQELCWFNADEVRHNKLRNQNIYAGQRVRYLLDHILSREQKGCTVEGSATGGPLITRERTDAIGAANIGPLYELTFDQFGSPVLSTVFQRLRSQHIKALPPDLQAYCPEDDEPRP